MNETLIERDGKFKVYLAGKKHGKAVDMLTEDDELLGIKSLKETRYLYKIVKGDKARNLLDAVNRLIITPRNQEEAREMRIERLQNCLENTRIHKEEILRRYGEKLGYGELIKLIKSQIKDLNTQYSTN